MITACSIRNPIFLATLEAHDHRLLCIIGVDGATTRAENHFCFTLTMGYDDIFALSSCASCVDGIGHLLDHLRSEMMWLGSLLDFPRENGFHQLCQPLGPEN